MKQKTPATKERNMQLEKMTVKQLRLLREKIEAAIETKTVETKAKLREQSAKMAADAGTSLGEMDGSGTKKKRQSRMTLTARRDPVTGVTWAGIGRTPANFDKARSVPA